MSIDFDIQEHLIATMLSPFIEEDELDSDGEYGLISAAPRSSSKQNKSKEKPERVLVPTKKRKRRENEDDGERGVGVMGERYRQLSFEIDKGIQSNPTWALVCDKIDKGPNDSTLSRVKNVIIDPSNQWATLVRGADRDMRCTDCQSRGHDCIVKVEYKDDTDAEASDMQIVSSCIFCQAWRKGCSIHLGAIHSKKNESSTSSSTIQRLPNFKNTPTPSAHTKLNLTSSVATSSSSTKVMAPRLPLSRSAAPNPPVVVDAQTSCADKEEVILAIKDIEEFTESMKELLSKGSGINFAARSMFVMVDGHLRTLRAFVDKAR